MFRWLRKSEPSIPASRVSSLVGNLVDAAWNATGTMTWRDMFGIMNHERSYTDQSQTALRLSAVFCGVKIYTGMINSLPRRMYALEAGSGERTRVVTSTEHPAARLFSHYFHPELLSDDALMMIVYDVLMDALNTKLETEGLGLGAAEDRPLLSQVRAQASSELTQDLVEGESIHAEQPRSMTKSATTVF